MSLDLRGSFVPLPTPFTAGGEDLDLDALGRLVDLHAARRTAGLVPLGTTGETPTLTQREWATVLEATVSRAAGRRPVLAGVGTNATRTTVERARFAERAGAAGLLVVTPYYNRPSPRGLFLHYAAVAEAVELPVVLYNVPSRTGVDLKPDVVAALRERFPHVRGIKEAGASAERVRELAAIDGMAVLSGEDAKIGEFVQAGAVGAVAVTANVAPDAVAEWIETSGPDGDPFRAAELASQVLPVARAMFLDVNPVPVKAALAELGLCRADVRLPLAPLDDATRARLRADLARAKLVAS